MDKLLGELNDGNQQIDSSIQKLSTRIASLDAGRDDLGKVLEELKTAAGQMTDQNRLFGSSVQNIATQSISLDKEMDNLKTLLATLRKLAPSPKSNSAAATKEPEDAR